MFKMRIILSIISESVFISHLISTIFERIIKYNQENISAKYFYFFFLLGNCPVLNNNLEFKVVTGDDKCRQM